MRTFIFLIVVALIVAGATEWEIMDFAAPGPAPKETVILIPPGEHLASISQDLANRDLIRNPILFHIGVQARGKAAALKAGEYAIPAHASMADIMGILVSGKSIEHKLTAAEGLTSQMIYDIVKADPVLTGDVGAVPAEGRLLPETYLFTRGVSRAEMIARMEKAQQKLLARLWPARAANLPFTSEAEAVTLASIVEKETAIPAERRHIAAVFENRLRLGIRLQSDPTIIYGITRGYPLGRGIRESELNGATPYNTYVIDGLPPTPICNPGKDSIAAVLQPADSEDLYFVADGTGGHVFTTSITEHLKNVANWRKIEQASKPAPPPPPANKKHRVLSHRAHRR
ncbi:MAG TPA: endolytic transglycosylase MltG [Rhizomicrobium sp.]|nr:endolytic transglycosylase MltG [Rhizomicrobium sp.]